MQSVFDMLDKVRGAKLSQEDSFGTDIVFAMRVLSRYQSPPEHFDLVNSLLLEADIRRDISRMLPCNILRQHKKE